MSWRYQPILNEQDGDEVVTLIEVYFDDAGAFEGWAEGDALPMGETVEDLSADLNRMMVDALCWEPVKRRDLKPGMRFTPRVSMEDRRAVADFIDHSAQAMNRQPKPTQN